MEFKITYIVALLSLFYVTSALPYGGGTKGSPIRNYEQSRDQTGYGTSGDSSWGQNGVDAGLQNDEFSSVQQGSNSNPDELLGYENLDTEGSGYRGPDNGVNHFGDNESGKEGADLGPHGYSPKDTGHESESWLQKLSNKWNKLKEKTSTAAESVGRSVQTWYKNIHNKLPQIWDDFKRVLSKFSLMIHRGAEYVVHKISLTVDEVKASELIKKLERRLVEGDEMVDEFFQKVGEKTTHWMQQHQHANIDEGFFKENTDYSQHFAEPDFPDIFQDPEIHVQLDKMVAGGVITQEEMNLLYQENDHGTSGSVPVLINPQTETHAGGVDATPYSDGKISPVSHPKDLGESELVVDPHHTVKKELLDAVSQSQGEGYPSAVSPVKPQIEDVEHQRYPQIEERPTQSRPQIEEYPSDGYAVDEVVPPQENPQVEEYPPQGYPQIDERPPPGNPQIGELPSQGYPQIEEQPSQGYPQIEEQPFQGYPQIEEQPSQGYPQIEEQPSQGYPQIEEQTSQGYPQIEEQPSQGYPQTGEYPSVEEQGSFTSQQTSKGQQIYFPSIW